MFNNLGSTTESPNNKCVWRISPTVVRNQTWCELKHREYVSYMVLGFGSIDPCYNTIER